MRSAGLFLRGRHPWVAAAVWLLGSVLVLLWFRGSVDAYFSARGLPRKVWHPEIFLVPSAAIAVGALSSRLPVIDRLGHSRLAWWSGVTAMVTIGAYAAVPFVLLVLAKTLPREWMPSGEGFRFWASTGPDVPSEAFTFAQMATLATVVVAEVSLVLLATALTGPVKGPVLGLVGCVLLLAAQCAPWGELVPLALGPGRERLYLRAQDVVASVLVAALAIGVWARTRGCPRRSLS